MPLCSMTCRSALPLAVSPAGPPRRPRQNPRNSAACCRGHTMRNPPRSWPGNGRATGRHFLAFVLAGRGGQRVNAIGCGGEDYARSVFDLKRLALCSNWPRPSVRQTWSGLRDNPPARAKTSSCGAFGSSGLDDDAVIPAVWAPATPRNCRRRATTCTRYRGISSPAAQIAWCAP